MSSNRGSGSIHGDVPENIRLYIGNIPMLKTKREVERELINAGVPGVQSVIMYKNYYEECRNRGYVFVEFTNHVTASIVLDYFQGVLRLFGRDVFMAWAKPTSRVKSGVMEEVKGLFIRGIKVSTNKDGFMFILTKIIKHTSFEKVFKDQGHAFVHFFTREAAERAMNNLLYAMKQAKYSHLQWEVTWAIPQESIVTTSENIICPECEERRWSATVYSVISLGCIF